MDLSTAHWRKSSISPEDFRDLVTRIKRGDLDF